MDFPILTALVVIPAVSALIVALLPARRPERSESTVRVAVRASPATTGRV